MCEPKSGCFTRMAAENSRLVGCDELIFTEMNLMQLWLVSSTSMELPLADVDSPVIITELAVFNVSKPCLTCPRLEISTRFSWPALALAHAQLDQGVDDFCGVQTTSDVQALR